MSQYQLLLHIEISVSPAAHDITVAREDFGKTAYHHIRIRKDTDVAKVANSLIHHDQKVIVIG